MRKDIEIHINTGDIALLSKGNFVLRPFKWVSGGGGIGSSRKYIYGEITVPANISEASIRKSGVHVHIPYTPKYREFYICIKRERLDGSYDYVLNPANGREWYIVQSTKCGSKFENIHASELMTISEDSFYIRLNDNIAELYSSSSTDVNIINANRQNANLLLKCVPTNCYRYPLTGVGLIRWIQSNTDYTELAKTLKSEFEEDGVIVENASYNLDTHDLHLSLNTSNVDSNGNS